MMKITIIVVECESFNVRLIAYWLVKMNNDYSEKIEICASQEIFFYSAGFFSTRPDFF